MINTLRKNKLIVLTLLFTLVVLILSLRGIPGNPTSLELNQANWKTNGPFELSPERGRFALLYSFVEEESLTFSKEIGEFASPDVAVYNGNYVSLFAPGVSFITIPGYLFGKLVGLSQVGTFFEISLFGLANVFLIFSISRFLGANRYASVLGALTFVFATPAFSYAVNLYQHHISTFLILLSLYLMLKSKSAWASVIVFFLCALGLAIDYPNVFFMFPLGLFALGRLVEIKKLKERISVRVNLVKILAVFIVLVPLTFLVWFQNNSYGNPLQLSGTLKTVKQIEQEEKTKDLLVEEKNAVGFFQTRNLMNGFYLQSVSPDRGVVYFSPVILLGVLGILLSYKRRIEYTTLFVSVALAVILLYAMWGDPWGGWAFGSRYLIPAYSILAIFVSFVLTSWKNNLINLIIFLSLFFYSAGVNTLGALTTSANPPQVEVEALQKTTRKEEKYSYDRNVQFLNQGVSKSLIYNQIFKEKLEVWQYYLIIFGSIISFASVLTFILYKGKENA